MDGNEVISLFCQTIEADLAPILPVTTVRSSAMRMQVIKLQFRGYNPKSASAMCFSHSPKLCVAFSFAFIRTKNSHFAKLIMSRQPTTERTA